MNWGDFALKVPQLIGGAVVIAQRIKDAKGAQKKDAVRTSLPHAIELIEFGAGKDIFNDPAIRQLVDASIDAEAAALKARDALKAGILAKKPAVQP